MSGHTPGPWVAEFEDMGGYDMMTDAVVVRPVPAGTAYVPPVVALDLGRIRTEEGDARVWANARLIAAAPDLLAVVVEACAIFDGNRDGDEFNGDLASDLWKNEIHEKLTAALAKATTPKEE